MSRFIMAPSKCHACGIEQQPFERGWLTYDRYLDVGVTGRGFAAEVCSWACLLKEIESDYRIAQRWGWEPKETDDGSYPEAG